MKTYEIVYVSGELVWASANDIDDAIEIARRNVARFGEIEGIECLEDNDAADAEV